MIDTDVDVNSVDPKSWADPFWAFFQSNLVITLITIIIIALVVKYVWEHWISQVGFRIPLIAVIIIVVLMVMAGVF